jgi:hypothetical protein
MTTLKWVRPSGETIETNDRKGTIDYCVSLGWKPAKKPVKKKASKKR